MGIVEYLFNNGPTPRSELNNSPTPRQRRNHDIRRLSLGMRSSGHQTPVYYLPIHDAEDVVRQYLEVNPQVLDRPKNTITTLFERDSTALADAWRSIADEYEVESAEKGGDHYSTQECTFCGTEIRSYPGHLPECPDS